MHDSTQFNHKVPVTPNENQIPYFDPSRHENWWWFALNCLFSKQFTKTVGEGSFFNVPTLLPPLLSIRYALRREGRTRRGARKKLPFHSRKIIRRHLRKPFSRCNKVEEGRRMASVQKNIMEIALRAKRCFIDFLKRFINFKRWFNRWCWWMKNVST